MRTKSRPNTKRRGKKGSKMPRVEFNMEAIEAIKKRKKRVGKGHSKQSKQKGR